ncbi:hypothetical protein V511_12230 [Mesotoga sp. Brook.08.YT.4.2.5.1]|uniref:hypothetical protein n=1 Tax=unclassified Mesotoga TaxID=1184398 RepID=UPI000C178813|nr:MULTISPECIES: hypothetical protein [unclassified Mesotoga]PNE19885.1 hypothetical protein V511_12230 [Mesotoga sp. Brook.08.YT.4.2.5.1]PVD18220.1 hypothetical protein V512_015245 [Mesotoga sp. Brook.08.105.5.1]RAO96551.1 hypothetical protein M388_14225 [Mesotoga sp. Brook.08.YT.4.2.5.4.]RDI93698.1 hypothetical protein Q502_04410 [Mesotoga sp. Brook.08.YT.4.2.5.2.]
MKKSTLLLLTVIAALVAVLFLVMTGVLDVSNKELSQGEPEPPGNNEPLVFEGTQGTSAEGAGLSIEIFFAKKALFVTDSELRNIAYWRSISKEMAYLEELNCEYIRFGVSVRSKLNETLSFSYKDFKLQTLLGEIIYPDPLYGKKYSEEMRREGELAPAEQYTSSYASLFIAFKTQDTPRYLIWEPQTERKTVFKLEITEVEERE